MADLIAKTPCEGLLPLSVGTCTLSEVLPDAITSVSPQSGKTRAVSDALKKAHAVGFPLPNRTSGKEGLRCIWFAPDQAMLVGPIPDPIKGASLCDQSDGWAIMRLKGGNCDDVLARLIPVDLRASVFKRGHTARTMLNHMPLSITRTGANSFDLMVFRSMAQTAVHEISGAMKLAATRKAQ